MYGLIGKKLGHSFSADFFNEKFSREGIDECYKLFPLNNIDELPLLLSKYPDLKGLNVTIPYKQEVMKYLNAVSEDAKAIGAVNVIKITRNNNHIFLKGYNSDFIGFIDSLKPLLKPYMKNALILGTGGASKAVGYALNQLGIEVKFVSRKSGNNYITYDQLDKDIIERNLLIVNTTPLGMSPDIESYPPIPYQYLSDRHLCYDLVYNPTETEFLKKAKEKGAETKNGLEMLYGQAVGAWAIWSEPL